MKASQVERLLNKATILISDVAKSSAQRLSLREIEKLNDAKALLRMIIDRLPPTDRQA